jgi:hypothetical protein
VEKGLISAIHPDILVELFSRASQLLFVGFLLLKLYPGASPCKPEGISELLDAAQA